MIQKYINQLCVLTAFLACTTIIEAGLTTLKHFDPSPKYSANDSMMPPNSHFLDLTQAAIKHEVPCKRRILGLNFSGFIQKAVRARGYSGADEYGSVNGLAPNAFELGDFRGTLYPMGLFLGRNPKNGNSIWADSTTSVSLTADGKDNGDPANITAASITAFGLPKCLSNIAYQLAGYDTDNSPTPFSNPNCPTVNDFSCRYPSPNGLVFILSDGQSTPTTGISIFHAAQLARDTNYFGAFSLPIEYTQAGFRWEINIDCCDYVGLTIQSGFSHMKQYYINTLRTTATTPSTAGQTHLGPYSLTDLAYLPAVTPPGVSNLFNTLNISGYPTGSTPSPTPVPQAQAIFDTAISTNIAAILNRHCLGSDPLCAFENYSVDDVNVILSLKNVYAPFRYRHDDDDDTGSWPDMIFTPYVWVGGSFPVAKKINYDNILSLPFGNNGHASVGGAAGMTFDFAESVEVGFEGGTTYFLPHCELRPFPTHKLQRLLYPFEASVKTQPGMNWHFRALLNAYQFLKHINFWMTYELIEHRKDCFTLRDSATSEYFVPQVLTCRSDWRAQFFNAGLSFDIQPGMQASLVWQQPISPRNAYYPVSIMGSINFMF